MGGTAFVLADADGALRRLDWVTGLEAPTTPFQFGAFVTAIARSSDGRLAIGTLTGQVFELGDTWPPVARFEFATHHSNAIEALAYSAPHSRIAAGTALDGLLVFDAGADRSREPLAMLPIAPRNVAVDSAGLFVVGLLGKTALVTDTRGTLVREDGVIASLGTPAVHRLVTPGQPDAFNLVVPALDVDRLLRVNQASMAFEETDLSGRDSRRPLGSVGASATGARIFVQRGPTLSRTLANDSFVESDDVFVLPEGRSFFSDQPVVSPDGRYVAALTAVDGLAGRVVVLDAEATWAGATPSLIALGEDSLAGVMFDVSGNLVLFGTNRLRVLVTSELVKGVERQVFPDVVFEGEGFAGLHAVPAGLLAVGWDGRLTRIDSEGRATRFEFQLPAAAPALVGYLGRTTPGGRRLYWVEYPSFQGAPNQLRSVTLDLETGEPLRVERAVDIPQTMLWFSILPGAERIIGVDLGADLLYVLD